MSKLFGLIFQDSTDSQYHDHWRNLSKVSFASKDKELIVTSINGISEEDFEWFLNGWSEWQNRT